jgi:thiamine-triphosphatase
MIECEGKMTNRQVVVDGCLLFVFFSVMSTRLVILGLPISKFSTGFSRHVNSTPRRRNSGIRMVKSSIEVEQKFSLNDRNTEDVESRLKDLGFAPSDSIEMTDWYFDVPSYDVLRKDCWLRYRAMKSQGQWQLKKGQSDHVGSSTVYEEVEGMDAVKMACDLVSSSLEDKPSFSYEGYTVPNFPVSGTSFFPFARIFTLRTTWKNTDKEDQAFLSVDLDTTDFGYAVGEVEVVVEDKTDIDSARLRIRSLIESLRDANEDEDPQQVTGKLEYYLQRNRPTLYGICLDSGVIRNPAK